MSVPHTLSPYDPFASGGGIFGSSVVIRAEGATLDIPIRFDLTTDNGPAINDGIAAMAATLDTQEKGMELWLPAGTFTVRTPIIINHSGTKVRGTGKRATRINWIPQVPGLAGFNFGIVDMAYLAAHPMGGVAHGSGALAQCALGNLTIFSTDTTIRKTGIRLIDTSDVALRDISIGPEPGEFRGNGNSIGLSSQGRELLLVEKCTFSADGLPVSCEVNPNAVTLSVDHYTFRNIFLITSGNVPCFQVSSGVSLTSFNIDGAAMAGGSDGFKYNDTTAVVVGSGVKLSNIRWEQAASPGYCVYLSSSVPTSGVVVMNCVTGAGLTQNGYLVQTAESTAVLIGNAFHGSAGTVAVDSGPNQATAIGCFWNTGTSVLGALLSNIGCGNASRNTLLSFLPTFANNAAALVGGLPVGALYVITGSDALGIVR